MHDGSLIARRSAGALVALLALAFSALPVNAAEPPPPGLNWVRLAGAESCISAAALAAKVEASVGRMLFATVGDAGVFVDGHVARTAQGWEVTLELSEPSGKVLGSRRMQLEGADCRVIDDPVALVIAVTLYPNTALLERGIALEPGTAASLQALFGAEPSDPDPSALPQAPPGGPAMARDAVAVAAAGPAADRAPAEPSASPAAAQHGFAYTIDAAATGAFGYLPGLRPGATAYLSIAPPGAFPIEAGVMLLGAATEQHDAGRVRFALIAVSLAICPLRLDFWPALALCAGGEIGSLQVDSRGFAAGDTSATDAIGSLLGGARLRLRLLGPLHLRSALALALPLDQRRYTVQAADGSTPTLFRIPQLATRAELGLSLTF